jgi:hypothetical protein
MTPPETDGTKVFAAWHNHGLAEKHPKRPRDPNQLARAIVDIATGERSDRDPTPEERGKDPAAVRRGKLGGAKGGKVGAAKLTKARRSTRTPS